MGITRSRLLAIFISAGLLLAGCGGSSNSGSGTGGGGTGGGGGTETGIEISGTATAPTGAVAQLERRNTLLLALTDVLFTRAHAGITGLEPVTGADVELIRVDDLGNSMGSVLATGVTSITGEYTLTLPSGVDLSGDLVVRITGMGGTEMRAQVVQQEVDINPVSEFVLAKFIEQGTDLDTLTTASVIKLNGQVDQFDLTAGADMQAMLDRLEAETGAFVEDQIAVIDSAPGDAATLAGNYRGIEIGAGLHDDDQQFGSGSLSVEGGIFELALTDRGSGDVDLAFSLEEDFNARQQFGGNPTLFYDVFIDTDGVTDPARVSDAGVLIAEAEFEEEIEGDFGWRYPPSVILLQKAANANLFFGTVSEAGVRYGTIDTNDDQVKDAVDPEAREGDEVFRSLIVAAEHPASMTNADLSGSFGQVFFEVAVGAGGSYDLSAGHGILSFDGFGTFDAGEAPFADLSRAAPGQDPVYSESTDPAEIAVPYDVSEDGRRVTVGVVGVDEEVLDTVFDTGFDFFSTRSTSFEDNGNPDDGIVNRVEVTTSYAVKLPDAQLDLSGRVYRVIFYGTSLLGPSSTALAVERFDSLLSVNNDGLSATIVSEISEVEKASPTAEVQAFPDEPITLENVPIELAANGAATIVADDTEGTTTLTGYFSSDGSLGLFTSRYADTGLDPDELGIVILVEVGGN